MRASEVFKKGIFNTAEWREENGIITIILHATNWKRSYCFRMKRKIADARKPLLDMTVEERKNRKVYSFEEQFEIVEDEEVEEGG